MAALVRQTRPWLAPSPSAVSLAPRPSSLLLTSIGYRISSGGGAAVSRVAFQQRNKSSKYGRVGQKTAMAEQHRAGSRQKVTVLMPSTLVAPPFWRYPSIFRQPGAFFHFSWLAVQNWGMGIVSVVASKLSSMPGIFSRPRFQAGRASAVPTAKALHVQMSQALAKGDRETLRKICTVELFNKFAGVIDSRPRGESAEWELLRYEQTWWFPRLTDFRCASMPPGTLGNEEYLIMKQAVVSIASQQRLTRYREDKTTGVRTKIPGSERVMSTVEHVVIVADHDTVTYAQDGPWKIWGTLSESTYEAFVKEKKVTEEFQNRQLTGKQ